MNKIFTFKKIYSGLDYLCIEVNVPLTVKICSVYNKEIMDDDIRVSIENMIEHIVRTELRQVTLEIIYYHTFSFCRDIYVSLNDYLAGIDYRVVDVYIGDSQITDEANYINNIKQYFENKNC